MNTKERFYVYVSDKLREIRVKNKIKQDVMASKLGISRNALINIEKGRQHPNIYLLFQIAEILNIGVNELIPDLEYFKANFSNVIPLNKIRVEDLREVQGMDKENEYKVLNTIESFINNLNTKK